MFKSHPLVKKMRSSQLAKNKAGIFIIEFAIEVFIFLMLICFFLDLTVLTWKFISLSQTNTYLSRTVGLQGGIMYSAPNGYPGGNKAYVDIGEMQNHISNTLAKAGIKSSDYTVTINGHPLSSETKVDYRDSIETKITVNYKWEFLSNFVPGEIKNKISSTRVVLSEFKYRYDEWEGE